VLCCAATQVVHAAVRPYKCEHCGKRFADPRSVGYVYVLGGGGAKWYRPIMLRMKTR
jgi:hypothetical protein